MREKIIRLDKHIRLSRQAYLKVAQRKLMYEHDSLCESFESILEDNDKMKANIASLQKIKIMYEDMMIRMTNKEPLTDKQQKLIDQWSKVVVK